MSLSAPARYRQNVSYRLIYLGLGLLAVAVIALGVLFNRDGEAVDIPPPIEAVQPAPGSIIIRQGVVEVDLEIGYEATIYVDGFPVNPQFVAATGVYTWAPNPTDPVMNEWTPGEHRVRVEWFKITGVPEAGAFEWTFRAS